MGSHAVKPPSGSDERIRLRVVEDSDLGRILEEGRDPNVQRWTGVPFPYGDAEAAHDVHAFATGWETGAMRLVIAIADAETDAYCGLLVFFRDRPFDIVEIGYTVHPAARGRGLAVRALRLAIPWVFAELGAARIEARTDPGNRASQAVLQHAGFTREGLERSSRESRGERRDMICWSLLPQDPAAAG